MLNCSFLLYFTILIFYILTILQKRVTPSTIGVLLYQTFLWRTGLIFSSIHEKISFFRDEAKKGCLGDNDSRGGADDSWKQIRDGRWKSSLGDHWRRWGQVPGTEVMSEMIDFIDCWNDNFYRWHYRGFQKEKMGKNHHFYDSIGRFSMQWMASWCKWKRKNLFFLRWFVFCVMYL